LAAGSSGPLCDDVGEQRSIALADGSIIDLNARSRIRVRLSKDERDVELLQGQALFHVAKDNSRPFVVRSDTTVVRAVGTEFDVYRKKNGTVITVLEGRVVVESPYAATDQLSPRRVKGRVTLHLRLFQRRRGMGGTARGRDLLEHWRASHGHGADDRTNRGRPTSRPPPRGPTPLVF